MRPFYSLGNSYLISRSYNSFVSELLNPLLLSMHSYVM